MSSSNAFGKGAFRIQERISAPPAARAETFFGSRLRSRSSMRRSRPLADRNSRNAWAVVAKPPGTRIPAAVSALIISPSEAFLPPTRSRSGMRRSLSQATRIALVFYRHESAAHRVLLFLLHRHYGADSRAQPADAVR